MPGELAGDPARAEIVLREATGRLSRPVLGTARRAQNRARLVRPLYIRLDRLTEPAPVILYFAGEASQDPRP